MNVSQENSRSRAVGLPVPISGDAMGQVKTIVAAACVIGGVAVPLILGDRFILHIGVMAGIMSTVAVSMNLMLRIGQLSFAQVAFMGMGAYSSALLSMRLGLPTGLSFILGGVVPALFALVLGPVFLRIKGVYFVLLTFAFGQIVNLILQDWVSLFGGNNGLGSIPKLGMFGYKMVSVNAYYIFSSCLVGVVYVVVQSLHRSNVGAILSALDENESLGRSLGLGAMQWRIGIFGLSAFIAGLAGSLYAHYIGFLSPPTFSFWTSVDALVMNVIGGTAIPFGPILGAIVLVPLPELLRDAKQYQLLVYAAILAVSLLFFRNGLLEYLLRFQDGFFRCLARIGKGKGQP